jgi:hypothetical protein
MPDFEETLMNTPKKLQWPSESSKSQFAYALFQFTRRCIRILELELWYPGILRI